MGERVHEPGCRYETPQLVEHATGEPLTADRVLEYAREEFTDLYGLYTLGAPVGLRPFAGTCFAPDDGKRGRRDRTPAASPS